MWFARVLSTVLRSLGSVAGLNGRTSTRAGSGRNHRVCRFRNGTCDNEASSRLNGKFGSTPSGKGETLPRASADGDSGAQAA